MAYRHGVYISEDPTPIIPPVRVDAAMPVAFVTAPVHLARDPYSVTHVPRLLHTNSRAVRDFGFSLRQEIWDNYTACEVIFSQFSLYAIQPIVIINVLDPDIYNEVVTNKKQNLNDFSLIISTEDTSGDEPIWIPTEGILIDTVTVRNSDGDEYEARVHYSLAFNRDGHIILTAIEDAVDGMTENEQLEFAYTKLAPEKVTLLDYVGGFDILTGKNFGMELVNNIFPLFRLVPGSILAPGVSGAPVLAAVMETRASNINGHFRAVALLDVPTMIDGEHHYYTDVPAWKNTNNLVMPAQFVGYGKLKLGDYIFNYSSQLAGLLGWVDNDNSQVPYVSPSNKNMRMNALCYEDGEEMVLNVEQANYLNGQGIMTAINFTLGWTAWGNRTGAYPGNTDPKDSFIPIRRMFIWIGNTIVLTYWRKVDFPLTMRTIETIVDSVNIWLNGLAAREFILGGRIEFLPDDNPLTDLIDGIARFRVRIAPPPPMEEAEFILQYDPDYLMNLFA